MSKTLNWGIVGCGNVVERKSGPAIQQTGRNRIVALMRRNRAALKPFAEAYGNPLCTDDAAAVIEHGDVDIVYVATPPDTHLPYTVAAARAGKHVLVEKPMAMSADEAQQMIDACDEAGVQLFVAYYRRFQPHVMAMRELISQGRIGRPVQAAIDIASPATAPSPDFWRHNPAISGGGIFVDIGSHRLDAMLSLLGPVADVSGFAATYDSWCTVEQTVSLCLRFEDETQCVVAGDFYSGRRVDRFAVFGTEGSIVSEPLDGHSFVLRQGNRTETLEFEPFPAPHLGLVRHIEDVLFDGVANASSGRDGQMTEAILDAVVRRHVAGL